MRAGTVLGSVLPGLVSVMTAVAARVDPGAWSVLPGALGVTSAAAPGPPVS